MTLLIDPWFYLTAIPAVLCFGIAKGGFGAALGMISVPLMALVISPLQAAAILLPILIVMDVFVVKTYWGRFDRTSLVILCPSAVLGVVVGYFTADFLSENVLRGIVGAISLAFGIQNLLGVKGVVGEEHHKGVGGVCGALAGFTSYHIHAGGPPFTIYLLPKRLNPLLFAGTAGVFFAVVNAVKLVPYYALGQLVTDTLLVSLVLAPLAPIGVSLGHYLVKKTKPTLYYNIVSICLFLVGLKLLFDALS